MNIRRRHKRGFTLVELLVVVSIIALLIAILLPSLKRARGQAKQVVCGTHQKQISSAIWSYWTEWNGRLPYIVSPMNDGEATGSEDEITPGFGDPDVPDDELDPFNRNREEVGGEPKGWPMSLPNVLMPTYIGNEAGLFVCPGAQVGWPRQGGPFRMTYRPAAINQPNGNLPGPDAPDPDHQRPNEFHYEREFWGFMDGRLYKPPTPTKWEGSGMQEIIRYAQKEAFLRGVFVRDMAKKVDVSPGQVEFVGPHRGGMMVINKRLDVEYRDKERVNEDLVPNNASGGLLF